MTSALSRHGATIAFLGAVSYGFNIAPAQMAQEAGVSAAQLTFWRSAALILCLALAMMIWSQRAGQVRPLKSLLIGLSSASLGICYISSLQFIPVALSIVILYTYPLFVILFEAMLARRMPPLWRLGLCCLALFGIVLSAGSSFAGADMRGMALSLVASFSSAVLNILLARWGSAGFREIIAIQLVIAAVAGVVLALSGGSFNPAVFAAAPWPSFFSNAGYALGFLATVVAAPLIGATRMSLIFLIEPVAGISSAALLLDQWPQPLQWAGVAIILVALALDALLLQKKGAG
jgi:drug/metabolite transporter (DMT)-like permease